MYRFTAAIVLVCAGCSCSSVMPESADANAIREFYRESRGDADGPEVVTSVGSPETTKQYQWGHRDAPGFWNDFEETVKCCTFTVQGDKTTYLAVFNDQGTKVVSVNSNYKRR